VIFAPASGQIKQRKLISLVVILRDEGSLPFNIQIPRNLGMTKDGLCHRFGASISAAVLVTFVAIKLLIILAIAPPLACDFCTGLRPNLTTQANFPCCHSEGRGISSFQH